MTTSTQIILSQPAKSTNGKSIDVTIDADQADLKISKVPVKNSSFAVPVQNANSLRRTRPGRTSAGISQVPRALPAMAVFTRKTIRRQSAQVGYIQNGGSISQTVNLLGGPFVCRQFPGSRATAR